jgi:2,4-dienoyl-CoA reductase-like NADH-dependent reductase (Old Yellow Enzyme family)
MMHVGNLAVSGAGLVILEATAVSPRARISYADLGLWDDATEAALARVVAAVRSYADVRLGVQLAHAGRKGSTEKPWDGNGPIAPDAPRGWQTLSASALPFRAGDPPPTAASAADIDRVVEEFATAARRAARLGFDAVEIHGAHGYLLHQFLSPLSNERGDAYGGSLENRMRLTLRVVDAMRAALPAQVALGIRISATDWVEGGWDLPQSLILARELERHGCAYIHVSSAGTSPLQQIKLGALYQVPFAEAIRKVVGIPVIAVGLITTAQQAEGVLVAGQADAVAIARAILWNPRWPWQAAAELGAKVVPAPQYLRCEPREARGVFVPR